ncbi:MAG: hypothetical protein JNJ48_08505, partial [Phycisphaerae bacterium]|nr:hypothetical protein [Phycisphaerae bacterium]
EEAQSMGLDASCVTRLGLPDAWIYQDSRARQLAIAGIDAPGIAQAVREAAARAGAPDRAAPTGIVETPAVRSRAKA